MHLEELLATLLASIKTLTSSVDENNRLLRAQGATASDAPIPAKATRTKKTETPAAAVEPEPAPEPEPPAATVEPEPEPAAKDDDIDWIAKAKDETMAFRQNNPGKRAEQVAALNVLFNEFGVDKISAVPAERGKEFYNKLLTTFV